MSVLVDEAAEDAGAVHSVGVEIVYRGGVLLGLGWWLVSALVGSVSVVVVFVGREDLTCVAFAQGQDVVEEFASEGADDPFAVGVHPGRLWRGGDDA